MQDLTPVAAKLAAEAGGGARSCHREPHLALNRKAIRACVPASPLPLRGGASRRDPTSNSLQRCIDTPSAARYSRFAAAAETVLSVDERERIRAAYVRRASLKLDGRYAPWEPAHLFLVHKREGAVLELLLRNDMLPLGDRTVLDVGCGSGHVLTEFLLFGARLENLTGIDLLEDRIRAGLERNPHLNLRVGDGADLPFGDSTFDIVLGFTLFSSIKDPTMRTQVAREMARVLRPGGGILWYDFWFNPTNPDTEALRLRDIRDLFPGARVDAELITLAPPIVRTLIPRSRLACELLEKVPPLRTHWLAWITPPVAPHHEANNRAFSLQNAGR